MTTSTLTRSLTAIAGALILIVALGACVSNEKSMSTPKKGSDSSTMMTGKQKSGSGTTMSGTAAMNSTSSMSATGGSMTKK